MFYSPTKEFIRFSTYRVSEIKDLKQRIEREKVTYEEITNTQMRLQKLKRHYDLLQSQSHEELKQVLKNSQNAVNQLLQEKTSYERSIKHKSGELQSLEQIKADYQTKGGFLQERLRLLVNQKEELVLTKKTNDQNILSLDREYEGFVRQCQKQKLIEEQIQSTETDLSKKWKNYQEQLEKTKSSDLELKHKVEITREQLLRLKQEAELYQKQAQKNQILTQKAKLSKLLLASKIQKINSQKDKYLQNKTILSQQIATEGLFQQINHKILQQTKNHELEEIHCQKQLKKILQKVQRQEQQKCKWQQKLQMTKINLSLIKQKNENLKNKLNYIFKNDSDLIKTITSKKVYPNCKPQLIDILKKSTMEPFQSKENSEVLTPAKGKFEKIQSQKPSDITRML